MIALALTTLGTPLATTTLGVSPFFGRQFFGFPFFGFPFFGFPFFPFFPFARRIRIRIIIVAGRPMAISEPE